MSQERVCRATILPPVDPITTRKGVSAMTGKVLRWAAFILMSLFGLLGGLFASGYAFEDPGGWVAVLLLLAWLVPMVGLATLALYRPDAAAPVLIGFAIVVGLFGLLDQTVGIVPRDDWGPVATIALLPVAVGVAALGLHRAGLAGTLLLALGAVQFVGVVLASATERAAGGGPGIGAMLGGSSGVVVIPILVVGLLFLLSSGLSRDAEKRAIGPRLRIAH